MNVEEYSKLSAKNKKLLKVLNVIDDNEEEEWIINRQQLTEKLQGALNFVDNRVVYNMINALLGKNIISHNPNSQLSAHQKKILPTNDTRYIIHKTKLINERNFILKNVCALTHNQPKLDTYKELINQ
jgi:hypothetical protein